MNKDHTENPDETITISREIELVGPAPADDLIGSTFAQKYEVQQLLGRGGMSVVYKARHLLMDKFVALKVLHTHLAKDELSARRFKQEAQAASTLTHPGIVAIHDYGESNGIAYLVMEYVDGIALSELIEKNGPLSQERFLSIMSQVAAALAHAHSCGVVHRDLKPSNVMIADAGDKDIAHIVDFGIAKVLRKDSGQQLTQTGEVFGSPFYMSPEQCMGAAVDARADIYSFGCVMYESLCGSVPFKGEIVFETINQHINALPPPLVAPQIEEGVKQKMELLLLRAMAKDPEDRFKTMDELSRELRSLTIKSSALFGALGGAFDLASAKGKARRRSRLPLMVVTLTIVSCLSVLSVLLLLLSMERARAHIVRLQQSSRVLSEISKAQAAYGVVGEKSKPYFISIMVPGTPKENSEIERAKFDKAGKDALFHLDRVEKALADEPDKRLLLKFKNKWKPQLKELMINCGERMVELQKSGYFDMTQMPSIISLSNTGIKCSQILNKMAQEVRDVESKQLSQYKTAEQWVIYLGLACLLFNGGVVVSLFAYFSRGTPQRLRHLSEQAAQISKKRGLSEAKPNQDAVADLDMVLQELANALTEAEEREKFLREQLTQKDKH